MSNESMLEQRLSNIEKALAELQHQVRRSSTDPNGLQQMIGCMDDFPEFDEVVRYGRELRQEDRPDQADAP